MTQYAMENDVDAARKKELQALREARHEREKILLIRQQARYQEMLVKESQAVAGQLYSQMTSEQSANYKPLKYKERALYVREKNRYQEESGKVGTRGMPSIIMNRVLETKGEVVAREPLRLNILQLEKVLLEKDTPTDTVSNEGMDTDDISDLLDALEAPVHQSESMDYDAADLDENQGD